MANRDKKYPLLTKIGGKRDSTQIGNWNSNIYDGKVHEGFYTQEEIKEIIDYAAKRQITIVPEIEMPGHASAAIAAYPQLGTENNLSRFLHASEYNTMLITSPIPKSYNL